MSGALLPFRRFGPSNPPTPLVLAVPHAGRNYPPELLAGSAVPLGILRQLEDRFADRLIDPAVAQGAVAIVAEWPRAWIDLNRAPDEAEELPRPPDRPVSARVRSGLGLVPRRLDGRILQRHPLTPAEIRRRLKEVHEPYHHAVAEALAAAQRAHGRAVLVDCHSMPPLRGTRPPRIVVGDRHGHAASRAVRDAVLAEARLLPWPVALNAPYAGAHTLERHGAPDRQVDAIQLEIDRSLYLDRALEQPSPEVERVGAWVARLCWAAVAAQAAQSIKAAE